MSHKSRLRHAYNVRKYLKEQTKEIKMRNETNKKSNNKNQVKKMKNKTDRKSEKKPKIINNQKQEAEVSEKPKVEKMRNKPKLVEMSNKPKGVKMNNRISVDEIIENAGINSIYLSTDNYKFFIPYSTELIIVDAAVDDEDKKVLWYEFNSKPVFGEKAYYNSPEFSLELCPRDNGTPILKIQYSPICNLPISTHMPLDPLYAYEYTELNINDFKELTTSIEGGIMNDIGICVDLNEAEITRVDIKTKIICEESFAPLLDALEDIEEIHQCRQRNDIANGLCWSNNKQELCIYNEKMDEVTHEWDENSLSIEYRFMNRDIVRNSLGASINELTQEKLDHLLQQFTTPLFQQWKS